MKAACVGSSRGLLAPVATFSHLFCYVSAKAFLSSASNGDDYMGPGWSRLAGPDSDLRGDFLQLLDARTHAATARVARFSSTSTSTSGAPPQRGLVLKAALFAKANTAQRWRWRETHHQYRAPFSRAPISLESMVDYDVDYGDPLYDESQLVAFSADGSRILHTSGPDREADVWNTSTGEHIWGVANPRVDHAVFSYNGDRLLTWSRKLGTAVLWDGQTGDVLKVLRQPGMRSVALSPDASLILATIAGDGVSQGPSGTQEFAEMGIWDVGVERWVKKFRIEKDDTDAIFSPNTSRKTPPDQCRVLTRNPVENDVKIWNPETGACLRTLRAPVDVNSAAFSPDGSKILTASLHHDALLWSAESGECLHRLFPHPVALSPAVFSADGSAVLTTSTRELRIWSVSSGKCIACLWKSFHDNQALMNGLSRHAFFLAGGPSVATISMSGRVDIWDVVKEE